MDSNNNKDLEESSAVAPTSALEAAPAAVVKVKAIEDPLLSLKLRARFVKVIETHYGKKRPVVAKRPLDLFIVFIHVNLLGGIESVYKNRRFSSVAVALRFPATTTSSGFLINKYYRSHLCNVEQELFDAMKEEYTSYFGSDAAADKIKNGDGQESFRVVTDSPGLTFEEDVLKNKYYIQLHTDEVSAQHNSNMNININAISNNEGKFTEIEQTIMESRMTIYHMTQGEEMQYAFNLYADGQTVYLDIRNFILYTWYKTPTRLLLWEMVEKVLPEHFRKLGKQVFFYLEVET